MANFTGTLIPLSREFEVGMGFSVKISRGVGFGRRVTAPGSASGHASRVHVGTGRTGFSSGVGLVNFYTTVGHKHGRDTAVSRSMTLTWSPPC